MAASHTARSLRHHPAGPAPDMKIGSDLFERTKKKPQRCHIDICHTCTVLYELYTAYKSVRAKKKKKRRCTRKSQADGRATMGEGGKEGGDTGRGGLPGDSQDRRCPWPRRPVAGKRLRGRGLNRCCRRGQVLNRRVDS